VKMRILAVLLAIAALVGVTLGTRAGVALSPPRPGPPVRTFPHHYVGIVSYNVPAFDQLCHCSPNVAAHYLHIGGPTDMGVARTILEAGAVPLLELEPFDMPLSKIIDGGEDAWLATYAREVASLHAPVIMSFAPEANGNWYTWGYPYVAPSAYVSAWQHVVGVFRKNAGTRNVKWAWIMNVNFRGSEQIGLLWPGRAFVDILGLDGYFTITGTFNGFFGPTIVSMRDISPDLPLLITETAAAPSVGKFRMLSEITAGVAQYGLAGFIWFDVQQHGGIRRQDWRLEDEPAALALFSRTARRIR
jgi:hypothetical protein